MEILQCHMSHIDAVSDFYGIVVDNLEKTINYPKWSKKYPCRETVKTATESGTPVSYTHLDVYKRQVQYHPEFKSRPNRAHALFVGLVKAALNK